jgi:hypothetical protein
MITTHDSIEIAYANQVQADSNVNIEQIFSVVSIRSPGNFVL